MITYHEIGIIACPAGFGEYQCSRDIGEGWADVEDLLWEIRSNLDAAGADLYELGVDELPDGVDDISGRIHNEPARVFAVVEGGECVGYFGIDWVEG